ncbi:MAG TPA: carboxymuconolactone decarboxylase family protein [Myxococcota bacterium]|jgi:4-carboxymuconolactone decarboxylase
MAETAMEKGAAILQKLFKGATPRTALPPDFGRMTVEHVFGNVWSRPGLTLEEREIVTSSVLIALGREHEQQLHFRAARNLGISRAKLEEIVTHVAHYAGWPAAVTAFGVLDAVWKAMDAEEAGAKS